MATFTTEDLAEYTTPQEVNMRFIVVDNHAGSPADELVGEFDGEVVETLGDVEVRAVQVVKFEDESQARQFSLLVNGTAFRQEWAARENARHRATASV
jgi:hypothetical protein